MLPRFHAPQPFLLEPGSVSVLPEGAARHVQVLRMQPGGQIQLFDGVGGEWLASVTEMGRKSVEVRVERRIQPPAADLPAQVTLAMGMPANDRMDALVEKATELGVHAIQPLMCERSVLRLDGERALKKVAHWQAVAVSACEQSGRATVPVVHEVRTLSSWLQATRLQCESAPELVHQGVLSLREAITLRAWLSGLASGQAMATDAQRDESRRFTFLSGPEGGLSPDEESAALSAGWTAITLGSRVLRADTAPLAALSVIASQFEG